MLKYLGIDWGEKRIGLALGDDETKIASPFKVAKNLEEVLLLIKAEDVDAVVIGTPFQISDSKFPISKMFNEFLSLLTKSIDLPVNSVDERLSSKAADALSGDKKTKAPRDAVAAMIILQSYFDKLV
jgi:putative Holliday junction resolvase